MNRLGVVLIAFLYGTAAYGDEAFDRIRDMFASRFPDAVIQHLAHTPVEGLIEVGLRNQVVYVSTDGRFLIHGKFIDLESGQDQATTYLAKARLAVLDAVPESTMIIFEPRGETRHTITTFTDIDCPYCRRMHDEMPNLNAHGIRVRYMLFPRTGVASPSYEKAVSVWCADDRNEAMTIAKRGVTPEKRQCEHPVDKHMALARELGLTGTPMTITDTGEQIVGYVPATELFTRLDRARKANKQMKDN